MLALVTESDDSFRPLAVTRFSRRFARCRRREAEFHSHRFQRPINTLSVRRLTYIWYVCPVSERAFSRAISALCTIARRSLLQSVVDARRDQERLQVKGSVLLTIDRSDRARESRSWKTFIQSFYMTDSWKRFEMANIAPWAGMYFSG